MRRIARMKLDEGSAELDALDRSGSRGHLEPEIEPGACARPGIRDEQPDVLELDVPSADVGTSSTPAPLRRRARSLLPRRARRSRCAEALHARPGA